MSQIDMQKVCDILNENGIKAYVEQTGGGTATILAGEVDSDGHAQAGAGPGWFAGPGWTNGRGDTDEFVIGLDDDGESPYVTVHEGWTESDIAKELASFVKGDRGHTAEQCWAKPGECQSLYPHKENR